MPNSSVSINNGNVTVTDEGGNTRVVMGRYATPQARNMVWDLESSLSERSLNWLRQDQDRQNNSRPLQSIRSSAEFSAWEQHMITSIRARNEERQLIQAHTRFEPTQNIQPCIHCGNDTQYGPCDNEFCSPEQRRDSLIEASTTTLGFNRGDLTALGSRTPARFGDFGYLESRVLAETLRENTRNFDARASTVRHTGNHGTAINIPRWVTSRDSFGL